MRTDSGDWLKNCLQSVQKSKPIQRYGSVSSIQGLMVGVEGLKLPLGSICVIEQDCSRDIECEVVGFEKGILKVMPFGEISGIEEGQLVREYRKPVAVPQFGQKFKANASNGKLLPVGDELLGRIIGADGIPLDGKGDLGSQQSRSLWSDPINPINREPVREHFDVGVRAINALLTVGKGQRIGIFAGSGVGKSVLLGMMAKYSTATRVVVGLIGERGREVKEFIEDILGEEGLARTVVVAAPADTSPLMRLQGATYTTSIAEHFRDEGHDVLLIMDSVTRYAMAQREIALALGEPPATKGYPPSVFAKLPALIERTGTGIVGAGSITAFYTVLTEGDDQQDPIADNARAVLDGHFVLSRSLAEEGHYPAIDIEQSISRVMHNVVPKEHLDFSRAFKAAFSKVRRNQDLVAVGAYVKGADPHLDQAMAAYPSMKQFLMQGIDEACDFESSVAQMFKLDEE